MKLILSLTAICLLLSQPLVDAAVPSHIVRFKASNVKNITGFDSSSFIKNHYTTFQRTTGGSKVELMAAHLDSAPNDMKNIDIGQEFKAVVGSFKPAFVEYLNGLEDVEYIEPNHIYKASILPASSQPQPYTVASNPKSNPMQRRKNQKRNVITYQDPSSWGLARINRRDRNDLSSYTVDDQAGTGIHVYVFDSGIDVDHPDFGGRASMEANFIDYEDDADNAGHGTHVAGTIGGNQYGVAKNVILHGVKILDRNGDGATSALIQAIFHVTKIAERGRSIINLSLTGPRSQTIDDALTMASQEYGIPIFVSAGNTGDNACDYSPSANPDVFTVGASNKEDMIPSFSSFGECVRIYAPGTNIVSTWTVSSKNVGRR